MTSMQLNNHKVYTYELNTYYPPTPTNITQANADIHSATRLKQTSRLYFVINQLELAQIAATEDGRSLDEIIVYDEPIIRATYLLNELEEIRKFNSLR